MKKLLFVISFLFATIVSFAQKDSTAKADTTGAFQNVADSSKLTFGKVYNDAKDGIAGLAKALKTGAEHVYYVLVKQQYVYAIEGLAILVAFIIVLSAALRAFRLSGWSDPSNANEANEYIKENKWQGSERKETDVRNPHWEGYAYNKNATKTIIYGVLTIILFICVCCTFSDIVSGFVNPEYGAIKEIINFVRK